MQHGLGRERRLMLALPDGVAWVAAFLGAARLGAVTVAVNPWLTAEDHGLLVEQCQARLVVGGPELAGRFDANRWLDVEQLFGEAEVATSAPACPVPPEAPLYIQFTSGTTGVPKGAIHRHADLAAYHCTAGAEALRIVPADASLSVSKLFFAYGFGNSLVYPLHSGSAAVLVPERPGPTAVAELVHRYRVTILYSVPSAYANLVAEADSAAFASVRVAVSAGEVLSMSVCERASAVVGALVLDGLGSTEVGGFCCMNTLHDQRPGTVGRPLPGFHLELRDESGRPVGDEAEGRLFVRGPSVLIGYLKRTEETEAALVDGWLATSDRAVRHRDGTYTLAGRVDDIEMVGGITVSPLEVERVLAGHPVVDEVAVAAVPDQRGATKLQAFVVARGAGQPSAAVGDELIALARNRLTPFKVPRSVRFVDALPRTPTGKIRRFLLRQGSW